MRGLILELRHSEISEPKFWDLFDAISSELDRHYWYFPSQNWFSPPSTLTLDELGGLTAPLKKQVSESGWVEGWFWRPGSLSLIGDAMNEEFIELWGIEPNLAEEFSYIDPRLQQHRLWVERYAKFWINYVDSSSWEFFTRTDSVLEKLAGSLEHQTTVRVHSTDSTCRRDGFRRAGFPEDWIQMIVPAQ